MRQIKLKWICVCEKNVIDAIVPLSVVDVSGFSCFVEIVNNMKPSETYYSCHRSFHFKSSSMTMTMSLPMSMSSSPSQAAANKTSDAKRPVQTRFGRRLKQKRQLATEKILNNKVFLIRFCWFVRRFFILLLVVHILRWPASHNLCIWVMRYLWGCFVSIVPIESDRMLWMPNALA